VVSSLVRPQWRGYRIAKRIFDLIASFLALVILLIPAALIAFAIVLDSAGGPLFLQDRVGKDLRRFRMMKFRTMKAGNDPAIHRDYSSRLIDGTASPHTSPNGEELYLLDDPRVTRVGRFLRRTSLDEIPNLMNVLIGQMSLVGPRPPIRYEVEQYDDWALRRLEVKPGVTGLAQISGRGALTFREVVKYDLEYIDRAGFWYDAYILLATIPAVFRRRGV
jgi:lipopolysaccharide/colanic/teichoic acid biosynthesis glycosyltransferase